LLSVPLFSLVSGVLDPPDLLSFPTRRSSDLICYGDPATGANVGAKPLLHLRPKSHHDEIQAPRLVLDTTPSVCIVRSLALQRVGPAVQVLFGKGGVLWIAVRSYARPVQRVPAR